MTLRDLHLRFDHQLKLTAWDFDAEQTSQVLATLGAKWWRPVSGEYRAARRLAESQFRGNAPKDLSATIAAMNAIDDAHRQAAKIAASPVDLSAMFGIQWAGGKPDWPHLKICADYLASVHSDARAGTVGSAIFVAIQRHVEPEVVRQAIETVQATLSRWRSALAVLMSALRLTNEVSAACQAPDMTYDSLAARLADWMQHEDTLYDLVNLNQVLDLCDKRGLRELRSVVANWSPKECRLLQSFVFGWYYSLYKRALGERQSLAGFDRGRHDRLVGRYGQLDRIVVESTRSRVAMAHWSRLPQRYSVGQMGVLLREFEKRRRHLPIRQLMTKAGNVILAIKPVLMMSPLSVAAYLAPGGAVFDLVVFDEASQVKPVDALGALVRASQAVVVGDDRQLPPTSFFDATIQVDGDDGANATSDIESILGLFRSQGAVQSMLRWHYRSRHESLIAVSNHEFYDDKLVVFPSPDGDIRELGLVYHQVADGIYDRGRSRRNEREASVVAQAVMDHARAQLAKPSVDQHTLGVAAFSVAQMEAILDHLERHRRMDDSCEAFFHGHPHEPFFVKNLENVQGDERDVIFISVGYGRNAEGAVAMDFGPVNRDGGERRLNVLITRARRRCEVFTNLTADDIDLERSKQRGVRALKAFLAYAQTGSLDLPTVSDRDDESPFEDAVFRALTARGYQVSRQVGTGGFYIDLAVKDPEKPGRYLLGIECDGATYHRARSARDRDRLRQQVLEGLGWKMHRIWSTSWFRHEDREIARLTEAIQAAALERRVEDRCTVGPLATSTGVERDEPADTDKPNERPRDSVRVSREEPLVVKSEIYANVEDHGYGHGSEAGTAFEAGYRDAVLGRSSGGGLETSRLARSYYTETDQLPAEESQG